LNTSHISRTLIRDVRWVFCHVGSFCPIWIFRFKEKSTLSIIRVYVDLLNCEIHTCTLDHLIYRGCLVQMIL
jgi:hypothetical protein